ncbi:MAG: TonB-dependent receptor [Sulfurimonas denitrificans]|nr:TonB-dependent receptor [Sulfurimonas denitrificans]
MILIDGKRISASDSLIGMSDFAYSWVPLNAIKKIEVIKGPMSSLYGSSAIGGVVNIITKKPTDSFFGEVDAKYGFSSADGGDEQDYSINVGGKITDKLSATIFAQAIKIEPMKDGTNVLAKREGRDVKNAILNLWYDIDDSQQIAISSMRGDEIRDNLKYKEYYDIEKSHDSIEYRKYFDNVKMNLKYYMTSLDAHSDDTSLLYTHKMDDEVMNAEFAISAIDDNYIILGAERRVEKYHKAYDFTPAKDFKDEIDYTSFYLQDEIAVGEKTLLTLGARYDKHEKFGAELSPKANLVYKLDEYNRLKGGYGHGFNAPSLTQNSDDYVLAYPINTSSMPMQFYRFRGNSALKPEVSDSFEVGYEYARDTTSFKATVFYTKVSDLITYKDNGTTVAMPKAYQEKLYSNVDEAAIYGLEVEYEEKEILSN